MDYTDMEQYWIWLWSIEGMTPKRFYRLLTLYEDPRAVWEECGEQMQWLGEKTYANLCAARSEHYFMRLFARLERLNISVLTRVSAKYPPRLSAIYDPPPVLYVRGRTDFPTERLMAVVGSRRATRDGRRAAREFARGLAEQGVTVVSGLARGIDTEAHEGCLEGKGRTIAVLGCGVDVIYPPENARLVQRILDQDGSIVSEYPPGMPPFSSNFPARNRILSGLCEGVLVVEADKKSGAMITVDYAADQGREMFAVPGSIYAPLSQATNQMILDGATPVVSAWDILESFRWAQRPAQAKKNRVEPDLSEEEKRIVEPLRNEEMRVGELAELTGMEISRLNSLLTMLELRGIISKSAEKLYRAYF